MGICLSSGSSTRHGGEGHDNIVYLQGSGSPKGILERLGSIHSKTGSRCINQDAAILHEGYNFELGSFCGVFDGHGKHGHEVSRIVRNRLPTILLEQMKGLQNMEDSEYIKPVKENHRWEKACRRAFKRMDKEIRQKGDVDYSCSGTTAVVAIRQGDDLYIANLGDSRAVLVTYNGGSLLPIQLTTDFKPSIEGEAERIRSCNGRVFALKAEPHIQRVWLPYANSPGLAMSRAFGDFLLKDHGIIALPDVTHRRLTCNDQFIVLASDGVWDVLSNEEVAFIVWGSDSETAAAKAVVEVAATMWRKRYQDAKVDDCTAVCLFLQKKQKRSMLASPKVVS